MRIARRVLAGLAGAILLLPVTYLWPRGILLTALGIALALLVQIRRRRPLRKRVILTGAVPGASIAVAIMMGPMLMSKRFQQTPEQRAEARAQALKIMPPGWRDLAAAQPEPTPGAERGMAVVGGILAIEMLGFVAGGYVAGAVCLCLYGLCGPAWRRAGPTATTPAVSTPGALVE